MALTKREIDRAEYDPAGPGQQILYDGAEIPGFGLRLYPNGRKAFVLRYRPAPGRNPKLLTIGPYGTFTLTQARDAARKALMEAKTGGDPLEKRRRARDAATMRELGELYLKRNAKKHKKTWTEDRRRLESYIYPAFGRKAIETISRADVAKLHSRIGEVRPYEANRVLALISTIFNLARGDFGLLPETAPNPARGVKRFRERSRDRWVRPTELPALAEAIDAEANPYIRAAFWLYLLTGARRDELLELEWTDVDLEAREIRLRDTKAGRPHRIPLSGPAMEILEALPRQIGSPFVFPGQRKGKHLVNVSKSWAAIRERAGLEDVRLHDLRRTVGSWLAGSGASLSLIGKVLNHRDVSTTAIYAHVAGDVARAALEDHGARIVRTARQGKPEMPADLPAEFGSSGEPAD